MEERIAKIITLVFHPLFIPFYMLLVLLNVNLFFAMMIPVKVKLLLGALVFLTTIILPLLVVFLMVRMKLVKSFRMEAREERIYPLLASAIFYYITYELL